MKKERHMPTVQKRATSSKTANRRRDRVREPETDDTEEEYDDDEEERKPRRSSRSRREEAEYEDSDEADDDDEDSDDDEEDVRETSRRSTRRSTRRSGNGERPRRGRKLVKGEGIRKGWAGADETLKAGGQGDFLTPDKTIQLIRFLEPEPLLSCRQHWVETESQSGQPMRRPYVCPGTDCPLCKMGDSPGPLYAFNVLLFSGAEQPKNKLLRLTTTGYQNLKEVSADRKTGLPVIDRDFFAVQKTGAGTNSARVVFRPVKERDLEEDWDEIFDQFDADDLPDIIDEATESLFPDDVIKPTPRKELEKLARYLNDQED